MLIKFRPTSCGYIVQSLALLSPSHFGVFLLSKDLSTLLGSKEEGLLGEVL